MLLYLLIWLGVGGLIGWVASLIMRIDAEQGVFLNLIVSIVGAAFEGWIISPLIGIPSINDGIISLAVIFVSLVGAVILLAAVSLFRRGTTRPVQSASTRAAVRHIERHGDERTTM